MGAGIREGASGRMSPQREPRETIPAQREGPLSGNEWPGSGRRIACTGSGFSSGGGRISGNWRGGASGSGRSFTGGKSGSGSSLAKDCRGVLGRFRAWRELGGKLREIGGTIRGRTEVLGRFRAELEGRQRLERISLGKAHSEAVRKIETWREKSTAAVWKGQRDGRVRRRGGTPSQCMTVIVAETGAGSSARRRRSGWSRCGSSMESKLTRRRCGPWRRPDKRRPGKRRGPGLWRGQGWSGLGKRRQGAGSGVGRNAGGRSGTMDPAASLVLLRGRGRMGRTDRIPSGGVLKYYFASLYTESRGF